MKLDFPHKQGDKVLIFQDWENNLKPMGTAELVKFHRLGRTYILKEMRPESSQEVYSYQEWYVKPEDPMESMFTYDSNRPVKIRYLAYIGLAPSDEKDDTPDSTIQYTGSESRDKASAAAVSRKRRSRRSRYGSIRKSEIRRLQPEYADVSDRE